MKKLITMVLCGMFLCSGTSVCTADEYTSVDIEIQIGSFVAYTGGETRACQAPFVQDGRTLAPVDILSFGFGAEYSDRIIYNDVVISFEAGSNIAKVDGKDTSMPLSAVIVNESLMVPVRFVCDTLGALIEYEGETGKIHITKTADFSDLFGKPVSGYWCHNDYGWMINLSTDFDLRNQAYDGSSVRFMNSDASALYNIASAETDYTTISQVKAKVLASSVNDVVLEQEDITLKCGTAAYYIEYEDSSLLYAINNGLLYEIMFMAASDTKFEKLKSDAKKDMLSFCFEIDYSKSPENISELNEGGYEVVADKLLGFSVNKMNNWTDLESVARNITSWSNVNYELLTDFKDDEFFGGEMKVSVYTKEDKDTVDSLISYEQEYVKNRYNPKYLKNVSVKPVTSKENEGMQLNYELYYAGRVQKGATKYFIVDGYSYKAEYYVVYSDKIDPSVLKLDEVERMFDSIKFTGVKATKIGNIVNTSKYIDSAVTITSKNQYEDVSVTFPATWNVTPRAYTLEGVDSEGKMEFYCEVINGVNSLEKAKKLYADNLENPQKTTFCGKAAYKYEMEAPLENGDTMDIVAYVLVNKGKAYFVASGIKEVYKSDENVKILNNIMKSVKLK